MGGSPSSQGPDAALAHTPMATAYTEVDSLAGRSGRLAWAAPESTPTHGAGGAPAWPAQWRGQQPRFGAEKHCAVSALTPSRAHTPSTATPQSGSRASTASDGGQTPAGLCRFAAAGADTAADDKSCAGLGRGPPNQQHQRLVDARRRANDSLQALQLELRASTTAAARYANWPEGAAVKVSLAAANEGKHYSTHEHLAPGADFANEGSSVRPSSRDECLAARLVRYDAKQGCFEVRLNDGSTRVVAAQRVKRAWTSPPPSSPSPVPPLAEEGLTMARGPCLGRSGTSHVSPLRRPPVWRTSLESEELELLT